MEEFGSPLKTCQNCLLISFRRNDKPQKPNFEVSLPANRKLMDITNPIPEVELDDLVVVHVLAL